MVKAELTWYGVAMRCDAMRLNVFAGLKVKLREETRQGRCKANRRALRAADAMAEEEQTRDRRVHIIYIEEVEKLLTQPYSSSQTKFKIEMKLKPECEWTPERGCVVWSFRGEVA